MTNERLKSERSDQKLAPFPKFVCFREALDLLSPVMRHYRSERWRPLLDAVLSLGVKCAFLAADAASYSALAFDLASPESSAPPQEKARIRANLAKILRGEAPLPEPGM